jgi:hypothetical protein
MGRYSEVKYSGIIATGTGSSSDPYISQPTYETYIKAALLSLLGDSYSS